MRKILLLLLALTGSAQAKQPDFEALAREAFALYPSQIEFVMPEIEIMSEKDMQEWVCYGRCAGKLMVKGVYHEGVIYISDRVTAWDDWDQSLFVHEVIHHAQHLTGKALKNIRETCASHLDLELEAYNLQNEWLKQRGKFIKSGDIFDLALASVGKGCKKTLDSPDK